MSRWTIIHRWHPTARCIGSEPTRCCGCSNGPWRWEDYNAEPHHIDGGLAHVQERLIGYAVRDRGYRIVTAMTPTAAARKLREIGVQAAAPVCGNADWEYPASGRRSGGDQPGARGCDCFASCAIFMGRLLIWRPALRDTLRPWRTAAVALFVAAHWRLRQTTQPAHQNQHRNNIYLVGNATRAAGPESLIG